MTTGVGGCGGGCGGGAGIALVPKRQVLDRLSPTPAQAANIMHNNGTYGDWVTDVPVQGPTDPGIRAAGCWWKDNVLDKVTDRQGAMVPRWTQSSVLCVNGRPCPGVAGLGDAVQAPTAAATAAPAPPGLWSKLSPAESQWVVSTLTQVNALVLKAGSKPCATWPTTVTTALPAAVACFQGWFNANSKPDKPLRTDGTLDDATLCWLVELTRQHATDFPTPYPGTCGKPPCEGGLSTLAKVGIGVGVAAAVGGVALAVASAHGKKKRGAAPPASPPSGG